jgi:hypothetical protein
MIISDFACMGFCGSNAVVAPAPVAPRAPTPRLINPRRVLTSGRPERWFRGNPWAQITSVGRLVKQQRRAY